MPLTRADHLVQVACALLHAGLGWVLLPAPLFAKYTDGARLLRAGTLGAERSTDFSPLYLLLHVALPAGAVRSLQVLAGALAVVMVGQVAHRLAGRLAGVVAALACALAAPLLVYEVTFEPDLLIAVLGVAFLWWVGVQQGLASVGRACVAGALLGLSASLRPTALLVVGVAAGAALLARGAAPGLKAVRAAALLGTALVLAALPSGLLRRWSGGEVGTTMSVGQVFHMGNRPEGTGTGAQPLLLAKLQEQQELSSERPDIAHEIYRRLARHALGPGASAGQVEAYWLRQGLAFAWREPLALAQQWGRKALNFALAPYAHDIIPVRLAEASLQGRGLLPAHLLALPGLAGLLVGLLRRQRVGWLWALIGTQLAACLSFYVIARYQLPVLPLWCVGVGLLGGALTAQCPGEARPTEARRALAFAAVALFGLWALSSRTQVAARILQRGAEGGADAQRALTLRDQGRWEEARAAYVRAEAAHPYLRLSRDLRGLPFDSKELAKDAAAGSIERFGLDTPADAFLAAALAVRAGYCQESLPLLEQLARDDFRWAVFDFALDPDLLAAECLLRDGRREEARAHAESSLRRTPGGLQALAAVVMSGEGAAVAQATEALARLHDPLSADYALARAALTWGRADVALRHAQRLVEALPESGVAHYERARALAALGRHAEALGAYERALLLFPAFAFETAPLDASLAAELARAPEDAALLSLSAEHAYRQGRRAEAGALLARARQHFGGVPSAAHRAREAILAAP